MSIRLYDNDLETSLIFFLLGTLLSYICKIYNKKNIPVHDWDIALYRFSTTCILLQMNLFWFAQIGESNLIESIATLHIEVGVAVIERQYWRTTHIDLLFIIND